MTRKYPARALFALAIAACLAGCASAPPPPSEASLAMGPQAAPNPGALRAPVREVTRDAAVDTARRDAAGLGLSNADVAVQRMGTHWVVELRAKSGAGLRYAISLHDGSIRQRNVFQ